MTSIYLFTLASVAGISLISLIGVFTLFWRVDTVKKNLFHFVSVAVGALLGDAFIHLIPEAMESSPDVIAPSLLIIGGIVAFFVIEKFFHWHHHGEDVHTAGIHPVGRLIIFSDIAHNFMDGLIIAASFSVSVPVGIATTLAVMLHEIPQEIGDFAVLVHAGFTRSKALLINFLTALSALLGAAVFFLLGQASELVEFFVPIIAGGFIYIAMSDLIPELHKIKNFRQSLYQLIALLLGVGAMILLVFFE